MKKFLLLVTACAAFGLLVGCSNASDNAPATNTPISTGGSSTGIVAGSVQPSLSQVGETNAEGITKFHYEVVNQTENAVNLPFSSGMEYDYIIYDSTNKEIMRYSSLAMFAQVMKEVSLKQGEKLSYDIELQPLEKGSYTLEVWLTPNSGEMYKQRIPFEIK